VGTLSIIDTLYEEHKLVLSFLDQHQEISLRNIADDRFKKILVLASASYFEFVIQNIILEFVSRKSAAHAAVVAIVQAKAIARQYHTYFDWEDKNANRFFAMFGSSFSDTCKEEVKNTSVLDDAVRAFLEIGKTRNVLVHQNAGSYFLEKTAEEIHQLHSKAIVFVDFISAQLAKC
jgi:hypothetical protein